MNICICCFCFNQTCILCVSIVYINLNLCQLTSTFVKAHPHKRWSLQLQASHKQSLIIRSRAYPWRWWAQMDSNHRPRAYQARALTTWAMSPYGGDKEARTPDPLLAKQVLSQLSYTPTLSRFGHALFWGSFAGPSKLNNIKSAFAFPLFQTQMSSRLLVCLTP